MKLTEMTYQQIQKIINDCDEMIEVCNIKINVRSQQISKARKVKSLYQRKKNIYEDLLKASKVDFSGLIDSVVDDISSIF